MCRQLLITGHVQGVGFRYAMQAEALRLGIHGWVRNRFDGSVEAVICGERKMINQMIAWARRGPSSARVTRMEISETTGDYAGFEILSTS